MAAIEVSRITARLSELPLLAGLIAGALNPGNVVSLTGDLGAGKTTLARQIIRAVLGAPDLEVPSPTFPIVQIYEQGDQLVGHFDFYRLEDPREIDEIGFADVVASGVAIVEWPERAGLVSEEAWLGVAIADGDRDDVRQFVFHGEGRLASLAHRIALAFQFAVRAGWSEAEILGLYGDASSRRYFRLLGQDRSALLMDAPAMPDGPKIYAGRSYGQVAHLAESVRPFVAIDRALATAGISVPEIYDDDIDNGLLLIEDLGDAVFGQLVGDGGDLSTYWQAAVDVLVHLRTVPVPESLAVGDGGADHFLPAYDAEALRVEVGLLLQWYWPAVTGRDCPDDIWVSFEATWAPLFAQLLQQPVSWVLRDFHSPNLIWLAAREGVERVGVIDFQDALRGNAAYDLVSILQDARLDVPHALEAQLLEYYLARVAVDDPSFDQEAFRFAYNLLGAQRNTKILGIFARLACRDGKTQYLQHLPRIWGYLEGNLKAVTLTDLAAWYEQHLPRELREWPTT